MIENFATLEEIFEDELFDELVAGIMNNRVVSVDGDMEKFQEIIEWVKIHGAEPSQSRNIKERKLYSRLKGIRNNPEKWEIYKPYDVLDLLGGDELDG